ncbi:flagellar associated [Micractinium conductrix]|uniref:Dynein regulatory complex subunit 2 n=1 Tax=Micractinium conductrix TaxID=554055 RepID=A0A2P6VP07_9CHLO|nr:flagellar associated [Micractinium conductrix]|eukprot:PSC75832.1 flagellar associated [Micractinium conductrix]
MEALAAAEAEAARSAAAGEALRAKAARERELTAVNSRLLGAEWLQRMRAAKTEELQAEATALSRSHDDAVDRCDRLIESLLEDVNVQNTQHDAAAAAHADVLDTLLSLHRERTDGAQQRFEGELKAVQEEFESERAEMAALHHRRKKELADVAAALAADYAEARAEAAAAYRLMEEELKNRASEALNVTKLSLEGRVRELEAAVEEQHRSYVEDTGAQEAAFRELAAADAAAADAIAQRTARLRQLQETLAQWRGRVVTHSNEWQRRNAALAREKEIVLGHHTALKGALAAFRRTQEARLKQMCVICAAVEAELKEHLARAQRIVRLAQLSRKYELPGETAAAAAAAASEAQAAQIAEAQQADGDEPVAGTQQGQAAAAAGWQQEAAPAQGDDETLAELGLVPGSAAQRLLDAFLRRMGSAALDAAALGQEKLRLEAENATLRAVVAAVQAGTSVGAGAVDDPLNTLLVVNGRLQKALGGAAAARRAVAAMSNAPR